MEKFVNLEDEEQRRIFKEALAEAVDNWLDRQWASFGKWTARGAMALLFGFLAYMYFTTHGFKVPS